MTNHCYHFAFFPFDGLRASPAPDHELRPNGTTSNGAGETFVLEETTCEFLQAIIQY